MAPKLHTHCISTPTNTGNTVTAVSHSWSTFPRMPACSFKKSGSSAALLKGRKDIVVHFQLFLCICLSCQWRVDLRCAEVRTTAPLTHSNYSLTDSDGSPKQADSTVYKVIHLLLLKSIIFKQQHYRKQRENWNTKYHYCILHTYIHWLWQFFILEADILLFV